MIRLLQWLFFGHVHKWKILKERNAVKQTMCGEYDYTRYYLQCEHCGKVKFT